MAKNKINFKDLLFLCKSTSIFITYLQIFGLYRIKLSRLNHMHTPVSPIQINVN